MRTSPSLLRPSAVLLVCAVGLAGITAMTHPAGAATGVVPIGQVQEQVADDEPAAQTLTSPLVDTEVSIGGVIHQRILTDSGQRGFFVQNTATTADGDSSTSDGIFVFTGTGAALADGYEPAVGDEVVLTARVSEYFNLTQLTDARLVELVRSDVDLSAEVPAFPVVPPDQLEAANRWWERREGMRAQVPHGALVQGGRDVFGGDDGELWAIPGHHPVADRDEPYTDRVFRDAHPLDNHPAERFDDGNGYRFLMGSFGIKHLEDDTAALIAPGRTFDSITNAPTGGVYFSFGKYVVEIGSRLELTQGVDPAENAPPQAPERHREFTVATANVENLYDLRDDPFDPADAVAEDYVPDTQDAYDGLLDGLAAQIAVDLHAPDVVMVQEAEGQDLCTAADGALACGDTDDADGRPDTLQELALRLAADHGVAYDAAYDRDGADDRGIVSAHLYRTDRVEVVEPAPDDPVLGADPQVAFGTTPLPANADVQNPKALNAVLPDEVLAAAEDDDADYFSTDGTDVFTRAPQVAHFRVWRTAVGEGAPVELWAVSNHFSSGPDARVLQRTEQAAYNAAIVEAVEAAHPEARVVVGGDFNVHPRPDDPYGRGNPHGDGVTDQLGPLYRRGLGNLWEHVLADVPSAAYSYVFNGEAQTLDSMFVDADAGASLRQVRYAHVNADWPAEFDGDGARGVSDHDPMVARFRFAGCG